jgi:uncharacterized repeat protein (TIGR02543 family)
MLPHPESHSRLALIFMFVVLAFSAAPHAYGQVVINELIPANIDGLLDEDGDTSDWIELLNTGAETVDLTGWGLSDNPTIPLKWRFPPLHIAPGEHKIVFASGKERDAANYWHTIVNRGANFSYRANETAPPVDWHLPSFDAYDWSEGPSGFGFQDGDDNTILPQCISASLRHKFIVDNLSETSLMVLHVDYDDAFIVWLNGQEIIRENLSPEGDVAWDAPANFDVEAQMYFGEPPARYVFSTEEIPLQEGQNLLCIEVHNVNSTSPDLSLIPFLTLGVEYEPAGGANPEIAALLPLMHTNFKLSAEGEDVVLTNAMFAPQDAVSFGPMVADYSLGRHPDGSGPWLLMDIPTPGFINSDQAFGGFADPPSVSLPGGLYSGTVTVEVIPPASGGEVRYTLDSVEPTESSPLFTDPILLEETTVLRSRSFTTGLFPSSITTHTYIINDPSELPVTSLVSHPDDLFERNNGILHDDNIWEDWERLMHLEYMEPGGEMVLSQDAGVQLFGGGSRQFAQKSLRLIARTGYGLSSFDHAVFPEKPLSSFSQLVWRNSGSEWTNTMFRDGLVHRLVRQTGIDHLSWKPSRVYLNGEYYGILNTREHVDAEYVEANNGVDAGNIDLIKDHEEVKAGDLVHHDAMIEYLRYHWQGIPDHFVHMETLMDMDNFIDYNIMEIFFANTDWPGQNIACWRPRTPDGRWRWILYDLDFGLGFRGEYDHDTLSFALSFSTGSWPNPYMSTYLLRSLVHSPEFVTRFVNHYCDHLNTTFKPEHTQPIRLDARAAIEPEITRHKERWDQPMWFWESQMDEVEEFLNLRPAQAREHLRAKFELEDDVTLTLNMEPQGSGGVRLSAVTVDTAFTGVYFRNSTFEVTAVPAPGYVFTGWTDPQLPQQPVIQLTMAENDTLTAMFSLAPNPGFVVINEICYNPAPDWNTDDWVELHNPGDSPVDISSWRFKDSDDAHLFIIPDQTVLQPGGFAVLCRNTVAFQTYFPDVTTVPGNLAFGFSGAGEALRLFDPNENLMDLVVYSDMAPWPTEPDGGGATLELQDPWLDNNLAESWAASSDHGSPGAGNLLLSSVDDTPVLLSVALLRPHPNPFNPTTEVGFTLDRARRVDLAVYDLAGRRVRTLVGGHFEAGYHHLTWNGENDRGQRISSGVYLVRMVSGDFHSTRKVMLVK